MAGREKRLLDRRRRHYMRDRNCDLILTLSGALDVACARLKEVDSSRDVIKAIYRAIDEFEERRDVEYGEALEAARTVLQNSDEGMAA